MSMKINDQMENPTKDKAKMQQRPDDILTFAWTSQTKGVIWAGWHSVLLLFMTNQ